MKIELTERLCKSLPVGSFTDIRSKGLRLLVRGSSRSFLYRRCFNSEKYDVQIGTNITLAKARQIASGYNAMSAEEFIKKVVPTQHKKKVVKKDKVVLFEEVVNRFIEFKIKKNEWTSQRTIENNISRIKTRVLPHLGKKALDQITYADVAKIAEGNWAKGKTVARVINIVRECFNWAIANGWAKEGFNPADMNGPLKFLLPETRKEKSGKQNHGSIPLARVPEFFSTLNQIDTPAARCFEFSILTVTRSHTVRHARWEDINLDEGLWTIPAKDLKIKTNGRLLVPLCQKVIDFLKKLGPKEKGHLFLNPDGLPFSDNVFGALIKRLNSAIVRPFIDEAQTENSGKVVRATQHGVARAGFKTWARNDLLGNDTKYEDKVSELCLHHKVKDAYNGAYERNSFWVRRVDMMKDWADFVTKPTEPAELKYGYSFNRIQGIDQPRKRGKFTKIERD